MFLKVRFDSEDEAGRYFAACARIRGITPTALFRRLLTAIAEDQMVLSVLDDEGEPRGPRKGEQSHSDLRAAS